MWFRRAAQPSFAHGAALRALLPLLLCKEGSALQLAEGLLAGQATCCSTPHDYGEST